MVLTDISWALESLEPKKLAKFYAFVINAEARPFPNGDQCWFVQADTVRIEIYRPSLKRSFPARGRGFSLCLRRRSTSDPIKFIKNWSSELQARGAVIIENVRIESFGAECWLADPEGNQFLIVVST